MEDELNLGLRVFSEEFKSIIAQHKDKRTFQLLHKDEEGKFQTLRCGYDSNNFSILYDHEDIEVYYNPEWIEKKCLNHPGMTPDRIEELFKFLAHHEYGHSFLCSSSEELKIFTDEQNSLINSMTHFNYLGVERAFRDFFADFMAKTIDPNPPFSYLEIYLNGIEKSDLPYFKLIMLTTKKNF